MAEQLRRRPGVTGGVAAVMGAFFAGPVLRRVAVVATAGAIAFVGTWMLNAYLVGTFWFVHWYGWFLPGFLLCCLCGGVYWIARAVAAEVERRWEHDRRLLR